MNDCWTQLEFLQWLLWNVISTFAYTLFICWWWSIINFFSILTKPGSVAALESPRRGRKIKSRNWPLSLFAEEPSSGGCFTRPHCVLHSKKSKEISPQGFLFIYLFVLHGGEDGVALPPAGFCRCLVKDPPGEQVFWCCHHAQRKPWKYIYCILKVCSEWQVWRVLSSWLSRTLQIGFKCSFSPRFNCQDSVHFLNN